MKLNFSIEYKTNWGETIVLCLDGQRYPLEYVADGIWQGEVSRPSLKEALEYRYEVVCDGVTVRKEWGQHVLPKGLSAKVVTVNDRWQDRPADAPFYSSAFTKAKVNPPIPKCAASCRLSRLEHAAQTGG